MEWARTNLLAPVMVVMILALGTFFMEVSGHELRLVSVEGHIVNVEEDVDSVRLTADKLLKNQEHMLYKMCLIINDNSMAACHK